MPNTNPRTGLPFGVINGNSLHPEVLDALYMAASAQVYDCAYRERKNDLRREVEDTFPNLCGVDWAEDQLNDLMDAQLESEAECGAFGRDEPSAEVTYEGVTVHYGYLGGAPIVFSYDGPVTHVRSYYSPCCPGAVDLDSGPGDIACHGVPESWLDKEE